MDIIPLLQHLGFKNIEARIYLSVLELGVSPVANIAHHTKIKRTTLYNLIDGMCENGVLKKLEKNGVTIVEALDPDELHELYRRRLDEIDQVLPELRAINNKFTRKPKISYFEGTQNVAELYRIEAKDNPDEIRIFAANIDREVGDANGLRKLRNRIREGVKKHPKKHIIINKTPEKLDMPLGETLLKKISKKDLDLKVSIKTYGNKTKFISMKKPMSGIVIEDRDIADTMRSIFDFINAR